MLTVSFTVVMLYNKHMNNQFKTFKTFIIRNVGINWKSKENEGLLACSNGSDDFHRLMNTKVSTMAWD